MASAEITTPLKRPREETQVLELEGNKKPKSYNHILSILDDEEEGPAHDISSLITTLQQEISTSESESTSLELLTPLPADPRENPSAVPVSSEEDSSPSSTTSVSNGEDDKESVMRHLLEASDDELGLPATDVDESACQSVGFGDGFAVYDGLWELEDEAANCYTLLQSELFM